MLFDMKNGFLKLFNEEWDCKDNVSDAEAGNQESGKPSAPVTIADIMNMKRTQN